MKQIQLEHAEWLQRNFPNQTLEFPAAGMVEEAGELIHALLKCQQEGVWGQEERYRNSDWPAKMLDAIGDCAIYVCSWCNTWKSPAYSFERFTMESRIAGKYSQDTAFRACVELVRRATDVAFASTQCDPVMRYVEQLARIARTWGIDFEQAVRTTWQKVKERNRNAVK